MLQADRMRSGCFLFQERAGPNVCICAKARAAKEYRAAHISARNFGVLTKNSVVQNRRTFRPNFCRWTDERLGPEQPSAGKQHRPRRDPADVDHLI